MAAMRLPAAVLPFRIEIQEASENSLMIGGTIPTTPGIKLAGTTVTATTFAECAERVLEPTGSNLLEATILEPIRILSDQWRVVGSPVPVRDHVTPVTRRCSKGITTNTLYGTEIID